jgi:hypothetical protein
MGQAPSIERSYDNIVEPCAATTGGDSHMMAACVDARKRLLGVIADPSVDAFSPGTMAGTPAPEMVQAPASIDPIGGESLLAPVVSGYMADGDMDVPMRSSDVWILAVAIVALALIGLKSN